MAEVIITITDTAEGQFSVQFRFNPPVTDENKPTPAQELGLNLADQFQGKQEQEQDEQEQEDAEKVGWPELSEDPHILDCGGLRGLHWEALKTITLKHGGDVDEANGVSLLSCPDETEKAWRADIDYMTQVSEDDASSVFTPDEQPRNTSQ